jgi:hypothetical protein
MHMNARHWRRGSKWCVNTSLMVLYFGELIMRFLRLEIRRARQGGGAAAPAG